MLRNRQKIAVRLTPTRTDNQVLLSFYHRASASNLIIVYKLEAYMSTGGSNANNANKLLKADGSTDFGISVTTANTTGHKVSSNTAPVSITDSGFRVIQTGGVSDTTGIGILIIDLEIIWT